MPSLTYCRLVSRKYLILNQRSIIRCVFWFGFIITLLLAQLWLEFKTRDLKIQTQILQRYRLRLADYNKNLETKMLSMEKDERLRDVAFRELKMVDTQLQELEYMSVPSSLLAKYKVVDAAVDLALRQDPDVPEASGIRSLMNTLLNPTQPSEAQQALHK